MTDGDGTKVSSEEPTRNSPREATGATGSAPPDTDSAPARFTSEAPTNPSAGSRPDGPTMLSVPLPAAASDSDLDERLRQAERRISRLVARVETLEARRPIEVVHREGSQPGWGSTRGLVLWLLALTVLVASWVILGPSVR